MAIRIGFDMDGVVADFSTAFRDVEHRLFGPSSSLTVEAPEVEAQLEEEAGTPERSEQTPQEIRRRHAAVWRVIHRTTDFWMTLKPHDPEAVRRIHELMLRYGWEVFFITQRPATAGQTVQRQTQHWLRDQGFDLPSVLVISGSRGAAAGALRLNYHVDDSSQNCLDVAADSGALPILIVADQDPITEASARRLNIAVVRSLGEALDTLERTATGVNSEPTRVLSRLTKFVGWD